MRENNSWRFAARDLLETFSRCDVWWGLAVDEIRLRYRRSFFGPFWGMLNTWLLISVICLIYSNLFSKDFVEYFCFLSISLVLWNHITSSIIDSCQIFIINASTIKNIKLPFLSFVLKARIQSLLMLCHMLPILVLAIVLSPSLEIQSSQLILAIPVALVLLEINLAIVSVVLATCSARFRDIPQLVQGVMQVMFFFTPIVWRPDFLNGKEELYKFNPFYHFIEVMREPILSGSIPHKSFFICGLIGVVAIIFSALFFARYRRRIPFWV